MKYYGTIIFDGSDSDYNEKGDIMGLSMQRCKKCGAMDMFPNGMCSKCGAALDGIPEEEVKFNTSTREEAPSLSALANDSYKPERKDDEESVQYPEVWMFVLSMFFPILQWMLMCVYVLKGNTKAAFELWWKPFIVQFALVLVSVLLIVSRLS